MDFQILFTSFTCFSILTLVAFFSKKKLFLHNSSKYDNMSNTKYLLDRIECKSVSLMLELCLFKSSLGFWQRRTPFFLAETFSPRSIYPESEKK